MSDKKLYLSSDKKISGVCGGIAEYLEIDPTVVRAAYAVLTLISAGLLGIIIYFVLSLILPKK